MAMFSNHLKRVLEYTWISSIMFKSSVEKSPSYPPSSSSFVSCDHVDLHVSDVEMGWVPVEHPSCSNTAHQSTNSFPASCQFERSMSSSSFQVERSVSSSSFQFTITVEETDWVVLDVPMTLATSILNPLPPLPSPLADHSASSSNQTASDPSSSSISTTTAPTPPPLCSTSYHARTPYSSNHDIDQSTSSASSDNVASLSSSSSSASSSSYRMDDSISTATSSPISSSSLSCSSSLSSSSSSNHAPTSTQSSLSSTFSNNRASTTSRARISSHAIFIMHYSFKWQEILLAISFTVPVGLLSATFEKHRGVLVPAKLFNSNPNLFLIFIILDAVAFTASVIGILLQALGRRRSRSCLSYLSLIAFTALMIAFSIYLTVLLPNFLGFIPWTLLIAILLVLLYVGVSMYNRNCYRDHVKSNTMLATNATIV